MLGKAADSLRKLRHLLGDAASAADRAAHSAGRRIALAWRRLSLPTRRRIAVAGSAIAVVIVVSVLIVPALPCSFPGGDECSENSSDAALSLVPGDAIAYVDVDLDTSSDQYAKAVAIASRTPKLTQQIAGIALSQFLGAAGRQSDFSSEIRPWFGGELLIAQLARAGGAGQVQMLQVTDERGAAAYAKSIAAANPTTSVYRGVDVTVDARGLASSIVDGFLVIGREAGVRSVIDVATDAEGAAPITDDETESQVRGELPGDAVVQAYVSRVGVALLFGRRGALGPAGPLVGAGASKGLGVALVATDDGIELSTRSALDPAKTAANPLVSLPHFDGTLADRVQDNALAYLGFGDPGSTLQELLKGAGKRGGGLLGGFAGVLRGLGKSGDIDLSGDLLPALGDEAAFALIPRVSESAGATGDQLPGQPDATQTLPPDAGAAPYIELLADVADEQGAIDALAKLEAPLAKELGSKAHFVEVRVGGVVAQLLRISPTAQVAYAVFDSLFVFATDPAGVRSIADSGQQGLSASELYGQATDGLADERSLLAYFDVGGLLQFAEAGGQAANPAYATFADDLRRLQALAVSLDSSPEELSTDSRLLVAGNGGAGTGSD